MTKLNNYSGSNYLNDEWLWHASITCFVLAGLTGFLYRLGMMGWVPGELSMGNIRHAHSHLMFFGWAVPLPLYIIMQKIICQTEEGEKGAAWMKYSIASIMLFGLLAYPFFLFYGYRPVAVGSAALPLSVIFSGFVMISWYGFMIGYWKSRTALQDDESLPWIDGALVLLIVCSLGAWGVAVIQELAPQSHLLMKSMTHFFLSSFTEGWVVLILCSILISEFEINERNWWTSPQLALGAIAIGAPLTFSYGISESLLTPMLLGTARLGGGLAAIGLLLVMSAILKSGKWRHPIWIWPVALLTLKGIMQLGASVVPSSFWLSDPSLRVLYLHILLLGGLTLLALAWINKRKSVSKCFYHLVVASIMVTLTTLLMFTRVWPEALSGAWVVDALALGALLPILAVFAYWMMLIQSQKKSSI
ncbi:hypothetical protein LX73_0094 [Fodinibius salinus]|uniref:Uncharacterized protein n=1 Tax=Fodinibius salinus TaxID=860790 RepID=A0A5D3YKY2_9BACT|nr:hypothetical protein [Fodinibius salinus]TYP94805.1 hypothetical protein LX73_0094 [Fodinibius salinus]